eukprot:364847-Chlamydomonas_euryale.AAC.1
MTASLSLAASRLSAPAVGHPRDSCAATEAAAAASAAEEEPPLMWLPGRTSAVALWPGDAVLKLARGVTSDDREPRMLFAPPPDLKLTLRIAVASTTASGGGSEAPSTLPATLSGRKGRHSTYVGTIHAGSVPRSIALSSSGSTSPGASDMRLLLLRRQLQRGRLNLAQLHTVAMNLRAEGVEGVWRQRGGCVERVCGGRVCLCVEGEGGMEQEYGLAARALDGQEQIGLLRGSDRQLVGLSWVQ